MDEFRRVGPGLGFRVQLQHRLALWIELHSPWWVFEQLAKAHFHLPPEARPDLYETLARCYVAGGRTFIAIRLLESCLDEVKERAPDDAARRRVLVENPETLYGFAKST